MLPYARAALVAARDVRHAVAELTGLVRGRVTVGMAPALAASWLPELLAGFRAAHPSVDIALASGSYDELVAGLLAGELDLAYLGLFGGRPDGVATRVLADQPMVVLAGPDDPLTGADAVAVTELRDRPLLAMTRGTGVRGAVDEACASAGFAPRIAFEAGDPLLLARLAARGLGVAVLPEGAVAAAGLEVTPAPLVPALRSRIELAWRAAGAASPAGRALVAHVLDAIPAFAGM